MTYEIRENKTLHATCRFPVFFSEEKSRREEKNAERMNLFYSTVSGETEKFAGSESFPSGGSYTCVCSVSESEGFLIEITARLRCRGRTLFFKKISHLWRDGIIQLDESKKDECDKNTHRAENE